jgi:L-cysteate sulfo-lyase
MDLSRFPRVTVAHLPTPLEPLDRLSEYLGGPRIWIKRDDCTGLATGGNKARKLEYLLAEALGQRATTIITQGATQSNHVRQTAAIAAKLGLRCYVFLERRLETDDPNFNEGGNVLLDRLLGAKVTVCARGTDIRQVMQDLAETLRTRGERPYIIPTGGSNPVGALGYVQAAGELIEQAAKLDLTIDEVVHGTGSAGTQAGLLAGLAANRRSIPVLGISVGKPQSELEPIVLEMARKTAEHIGLKEEIAADTVRVDSNHVGAGYGMPTQAMIEAVELVARQEGVILDPVYTGKAMAGLIDRIRSGKYRSCRNIVFWHTGGSSGLFGYRTVFAS